jgi:aldose sugar dehydrogenase
MLTVLLVTALAQERLPVEGGAVNIESLAKLEFGWGMCYLPDGRLLISEKPGRLRFYSNKKLSAPIQGLPAVVYGGQGGLLDVQVDPKFSTNHLIYISYSEAAAQQPADNVDPGDHRFGGARPSRAVLMGGAVARARLDGNSLKDLKVIWRQTPKTLGRGHFGGRLVFAPDGMLFITSGERMRFDPAQSLSGNLGKIIRINSDGTIPKSNPFVGKAGVRSDIWTFGHRNALGAAINPTTGKLWINEMGPLGGDELNIPVPGKNYGWPVVSNGDNYDRSPIPDHDTRPEFAKPIRSWNPVISPSGMIFYTGKLFPNWRGNVFIGGLSSRALIRLKLDGTSVVDEERIAIGHRIREVEQAPDGSILVITDEPNGDLLRLTPAR